MAQDSEVMNGLLGKIYDVMASPDEVVNDAKPRFNIVSPEPPFISFCSPGVALDKIDFGELSTKDEVKACSRFSQLVNSIPPPTGTWQLTNNKVWDVYERSISDIQLPETNLTEREREILERAQTFLDRTVTTVDPFTLEEKVDIRASAAYQAYETLAAQYRSAVVKLNQSRISASSNPTPENVQDWTNNGPFYEDVVRDAYAKWGSLGYRETVQRAQALISGFAARGPERYYERLRASLELARKKDFTGFTYFPTFAYPEKILSPEFNGAWTKFSFSSTEISSFQSKSSTSWGGGTSGGWGLWSWGGSASYQETRQRATYDSSVEFIKADLIQVPLLRPWMSTWIYNSRGWRGLSTIGEVGSISSGSRPLTGQMPVIPTSMILAKNVLVKMDAFSSDFQSFYSKFSSSASIGWGPFSLKGNYSREESTTQHDVRITNEGLVVESPQIIGFVCEVLPKSPDPDEALAWPNGIRGLNVLSALGSDEDSWLDSFLAY